MRHKSGSVGVGGWGKGKKVQDEAPGGEARRCLWIMLVIRHAHVISHLVPRFRTYCALCSQTLHS